MPDIAERAPARRCQAWSVKLSATAVPRRVVPRPAPCRLTHLRPPAPTCGVPASTVALPGFWALRTPITQRSTVIEWRSATPGPASDEEAPDPASDEKTPGPASRSEARRVGRQRR